MFCLLVSGPGLDELELADCPALRKGGSRSVPDRSCFFPQQVYDIAFSRAGGGRDMFASVGADGSVRMFDLRHLEHSTIIYEDPQHHPLLRLCWNKQDPNYLATMAMDGMEVSTHPQGHQTPALTSIWSGSQLVAALPPEGMWKCPHR